MYLVFPQSDALCNHLQDVRGAARKRLLACPSTLRQAQGWQAQDVRQHGTCHCICVSFLRSQSAKTKHKKKITYRYWTRTNADRKLKIRVRRHSSASCYPTGMER